MKFLIKPSQLRGEVTIPGSKSHTVRALLCAMYAEGESRVEFPLDSSDTRSCVEMVRRFGAAVRIEPDLWTVSGTGGKLAVPADVIDVGNSGTTLYFGLAAASLAGGHTVFTGDGQIRNRPADGLLRSLGDLGATAFSTRGNGKPPVVVGGVLRGGSTSLEAHTSQYLSALLLAAPLAPEDTRIEVPLLNEAPYVTMTLRWMDRLGIRYEAARDYRRFTVPGGQRYRPFTGAIPGDFSSATFFMVAAAVTGSELALRGLDFSDSQGDREVVTILKAMGADVEIAKDRITVRGRELSGGVFDLNAIPDALPALAVAACFARGQTRLVNVPQARLKETDRIKVMCGELKKMGARVEETSDGLIIQRSELRGADVRGHGDHRVVMALSVAGLAAGGVTTVDTAESVSVTFPGFYSLMERAGAAIAGEED